nr:MAG TPA: hypothetical protein [Caudoviricetes sp.]
MLMQKLSREVEEQLRVTLIRLNNLRKNINYRLMKFSVLQSSLKKLKRWGLPMKNT